MWQFRDLRLEAVPRLSKLNPITLVRRALAERPDEFPSSGATDVKFILDQTLRENLRIDISTVGGYRMSTLDCLHRLIDELPESELTAAARFLHYLRTTADPVLRALLEAPPDDEPETDEESQAVQEACEELARGEVQTLEEMRRELGL